MEKYYITTPIYYANGLPHIGHFLTTSIADVLARYYRQKLGIENVFFTTGLDCHGTTVEQAATKEGYKLEDFQKYIDKREIQWKKAFDDTNISYDYFVVTTNLKHKKFAQEFIGKIHKKGDIYQKTYKGKYCNGCEKFLTLSDQNEEGLCPLHRPDQVIETEEKNYFFKLSKYENELKELLTSEQTNVLPVNKRNEMLARIEGGLEDVSISRPKEKVAWGIDFPGDENQTIYVWVEALINYLSSLEIENKNKDLWNNVIHLVGKDINWFHNVIWPALLISAGYKTHKKSYVHSFLNISGQKISKSLGNLITPQDLIERYGIDGARYLILSNIPNKDDVDVTYELLDEKYNADLANGLGNLVARLTKLAEKSGFEFDFSDVEKPDTSWETHLENFRIDLALQNIWTQIAALDKHINEFEPWAIENEEELASVLAIELTELYKIAQQIAPFLPETSEMILSNLNQEKITKGNSLFSRL